MRRTTEGVVAVNQ